MVVSTDWWVPGPGLIVSHSVTCLVSCFSGPGAENNGTLAVLDVGQDLTVQGLPAEGLFFGLLAPSLSKGSNPYD